MSPTPEPEDGRLMADEVEAWLAAHTPTVEPEQARSVMPKPRGGRQADGHTRDVADLAAELAEARRVHELLAEGDPRLSVPTPRVLRAQRAAHEALLLRQAAQSPALLALRDARVRLWTTVLAMTSALFGLAWSASGVRDSVMTALGIKPGEAGAWFAWAVEPSLSLTLLATVGVQAYAAMRGRPVDPASAAGKTLRRTETIALGLILALVCWPAFAGLFKHFEVLPLLVHALGPIAAVVGVRTLPALWSILGCLPTPGTAGATPPPTALRTGQTAPAVSAVVAQLVADARGLIAAGQLPAQPSATRLQKVLRCGMDDARAVRDELSGGAR
ncbi:hypothetical protein [Allokutzneria oryzae]|uniref:Uncharacterized protein n=1 Tax=Allokutzneria oryzae TaxID=1378989 RepID=A0ABV6A2Z8_9PSEU